ncbi:hypothetical protein O4J56_13830 [Nocardiopsis sp. RSe5-2]|uniref:Sporulation protein YtfJ n=1 Tax=Nocardiopsis endophytica TaxID=3018445 RepID=A0ABT4U4T4_9ACTN|nr:hypothetical protein [Nocardiopsis endophytica]MDA2811716.1 hypothetical protein [Nocardiopsis endophytica]
MLDSVSRRNAAAEAQSRATPTLHVLGRLIEQTGRQSGSSAVFGTPIEHDGAVVVPVARTRFFSAFGAGTSRAFRMVGDGGGGQGFTRSDPAGYLVLRDGDAVFRPIRQPAKALVVPLTFIAAAAAVRIVRTTMRRKRRAETARAMADAAQAQLGRAGAGCRCGSAPEEDGGGS